MRGTTVIILMNLSGTLLVIDRRNSVLTTDRPLAGLWRRLLLFPNRRDGPRFLRKPLGHHYDDFFLDAFCSRFCFALDVAILSFGVPYQGFGSLDKKVLSASVRKRFRILLMA